MHQGNKPYVALYYCNLRVQVRCLRSRRPTLLAPPWRVEENLILSAKLGCSDCDTYPDARVDCLLQAVIALILACAGFRQKDLYFLHCFGTLSMLCMHSRAPGCPVHKIEFWCTVNMWSKHAQRRFFSARGPSAPTGYSIVYK